MVVLRENDEELPKISNVDQTRIQTSKNSSWHQKSDCASREIKVSIVQFWAWPLAMSKLGLEADPEQQVITTMQVHQGDQPRLPPSCIASLACVCMMAACLLLTTTRTLKFYICTDVPHTHTLPQQGLFSGRSDNCQAMVQKAV